MEKPRYLTENDPNWLQKLLDKKAAYDAEAESWRKDIAAQAEREKAAGENLSYAEFAALRAIQEGVRRIKVSEKVKRKAVTLCRAIERAGKSGSGTITMKMNNLAKEILRELGEL